MKDGPHVSIETGRKRSTCRARSRRRRNVALAHLSSRSLSDRVSGFGMAASADWRPASNLLHGEKSHGRASKGLKSISSLHGLGANGGLVICNRLTQKDP